MCTQSATWNSPPSPHLPPSSPPPREKCEYTASPPPHPHHLRTLTTPSPAPYHLQNLPPCHLHTLTTSSSLPPPHTLHTTSSSLPPPHPLHLQFLTTSTFHSPLSCSSILSVFLPCKLPLIISCVYFSSPSLFHILTHFLSPSPLPTISPPTIHLSLCLPLSVPPTPT